MRAYQRRRRGMPEADPGVSLVPAVVQPQIMEEIEMPAAWARPQPIIANGLESRYWHGTAIERRQADGFVNATAMCQANGKRWSKFRQSAQCETYMQALAAEDRISAFALVDSQRGGAEAGGATWIHPDLATELARWISPSFSVFVNRWFRAELESLAQPQPKPQQLPYGIHVVAATRRHAAELWWEAINEEVQSSMARCLKPTHRTDAGLPLPINYRLHLITT
jgi:hypothetical protein